MGMCGALGRSAGLASIGVLALVACGDGDAASTEAPQDDVAKQVTVNCTEDETAVDRSSVRASADGVHLTVVDESGRDLEVRAEELDDHERDSAAGPLDGAGGEHVVALRPGRYLLLCSERDGPEHMLAPSETDEAVALEILDPDGTWIPAVLECDGMAESVISDFVAGSRGQAGTPEELVEDYFSRRLEPGDDVARAGYPEIATGAGVTVTVDRAGKTLAMAHLSPGALEGHWLIGGHDACATF